MTSTSSGTQLNITLTSTDLYIGVIVVGALAAILGFLTHTIPSWAGYAGLASALVVIFGSLADEFFPASWVEYVVVTVIAAVVGVLGSLTGVTEITLVTVLIWALAILSAIYHSVTETGGEFLTAQQETYAVALTGGGVAFLTWWVGDPTASTATIITTLVVTVGQFLRVSTGSSATASAPAAPPTPPAAAAAPH